jgi:hypothetical protein
MYIGKVICLFRQTTFNHPKLSVMPNYDVQGLILKKSAISAARALTNFKQVIIKLRKDTVNDRLILIDSVYAVNHNDQKIDSVAFSIDGTHPVVFDPEATLRPLMITEEMFYNVSKKNGSQKVIREMIFKGNKYHHMKANSPDDGKEFVSYKVKAKHS